MSLSNEEEDPVLPIDRFSVTQRIRAAILKSTDKFLAIEMLLKYNDEQDAQLTSLQKEVRLLKASLKNRFTEDQVEDKVKEILRLRNLKIAYLEKLVKIAIIPIALASAGLGLQVVTKFIMGK